MNTKLFAAAAAALIALSTAGSALADSRDREIQALQQRAAATFTGPVFVTTVNPALDPALDQQDRQELGVQAGFAASSTGSVVATNDSGLAAANASSAFDPSYDSRDREIDALQTRAFAN